MNENPPDKPENDRPPEMPAWEVDGLEQLETEILPELPPAEIAPPLPPRPAQEKEEAPPPLLRIIEAMLFVGGAPLTAARACEAIRGLTPEDFQQAVDTLNRSYRSQGRPYQLQMQDHGYVLALRLRFAGVREKLYGGVREARLSQAAVDVLALVAYRQPATRQEIDSLRGADSGGVLRLLVRHGLVALQRGEGEDREVRYVTTQRFLDLFHLRSLDDLPQTQDLQRL
jgi:segregation and condensation protein B